MPGPSLLGAKTPVLQRTKLWLREGESPAKGHTGGTKINFEPGTLALHTSCSLLPQGWEWGLTLEMGRGCISVGQGSSRHAVFSFTVPGRLWLPEVSAACFDLQPLVGELDAAKKETTLSAAHLQSHGVDTDPAVSPPHETRNLFCRKGCTP